MISRLARVCETKHRKINSKDLGFVDVQSENNSDVSSLTKKKRKNILTRDRQHCSGVRILCKQK